MESNLTTLDWLLEVAFYLLLFLGSIKIGKLFYTLKWKKINIEKVISLQDNEAFSFSYFGYLIGVSIIYFGILKAERYDYLTEALLVLFYIVVGNVLLLLSSYLNELIVFKRIPFKKEILKDENKGIGYVEAANFIASGILIFGAISGNVLYNSTEYELVIMVLRDCVSLLIFWGVGQLIIGLSILTYLKVSRYKIKESLIRDNAAIGILLGSVTISLSILYAASVSFELSDTYDFLENMGYTLGVGFLLLPFSRIFIDKIILPSTDLVHEISRQKVPNKGVAYIEAFGYLGSAILLTLLL